MGRTVSNSANWFRHDKNLRNSMEVLALRNRFGNSGCMAFYFVLETLTGSDFYEIELTKIRKELLAAEYRITVDELTEVIEYCMMIGLLAAKPNNYIYCPMLSQLMQPLDKKRVGDRNRCQAKKSDEIQIPESKTEDLDNSRGENNILETKKGELDNSRGENPHIRKEKNRKEKNRDKDSLCSSLFPPSTTTPAHARDFDDLENGKILANNAGERLIYDMEWIKQMVERHKMPTENIIGWLYTFVGDCICRGKEEHESLSDFKQHFNDWLFRQEENYAKKMKDGSKPVPPISSFQLWQLAKKELSNVVNPEVAKKSYDVVKFQNYDPSSGRLLLSLPDNDTYEYMEANLVDNMKSILPKYFGRQVKLNYQLPPVNK